MTTIGFIGLVLWRPLPIHDPDRIVTVGPVAAAGRAMVWAQHYALWKAQQDVFTDLAAYQFDPTAVHLVFDHGVEEVTDMDRFVRPCWSPACSSS